MKKSLRFASAALALTLAAGMTLPAFAAAKADYSKDETVYAVMNADGSIKSTTVSEHLLQCRKGTTDTGIVSYISILVQWYIEVYAYNCLFAGKVKICDFHFLKMFI